MATTLGPHHGTRCKFCGKFITDDELNAHESNCMKRFNFPQGSEPIEQEVIIQTKQGDLTVQNMYPHEIFQDCHISAGVMLEQFFHQQAVMIKEEREKRDRE